MKEGKSYKPKSLAKTIYYHFKGLRSANGVAHQGAQECQRRIRQGRNGMCYIHGAQYNDRL